MEELAERVERLEFWMELLVHMVDPDVKPFSLLIIEQEFDEQRMRDIFSCMDAYREKLQRSEDFSMRDFEDSIYEILPERRGDYHLAESIVSTLNQEESYQDVYQALKERG